VDAVHAAAVSTTPGQRLTFSIGVASYPDDAFNASELVAAADQALYLAKREGKDRPCTFPQLVTELELADGNLVTMLSEAGPQVMVAAAHAADHRSPVTQGHSSRVAAIADALGRRLGMSSSGLEDLRCAAFLHDVGHMTLKAGGEQFEAPGHAEAGATIVAGAHFAPGIGEAVRHHHARWDGTGNSEWIAGETIPGMARVLAVAERFEALTAGRGCQRVSPQAAADAVASGAGTEFDPAVVDALKRSVGDRGLELNLPEVAMPAVATPELAPVS
jgi:putative nucleotidyltransferase with HDIG domain